MFYLDLIGTVALLFDLGWINQLIFTKTSMNVYGVLCKASRVALIANNIIISLPLHENLSFWNLLIRIVTFWKKRNNDVWNFEFEKDTQFLENITKSE